MEQNNKVHDHLDAAKEELKNAAEVLISDTKDKAKEIVGNVAASISDAADKVHADVIKVDSANK